MTGPTSVIGAVAVCAAAAVIASWADRHLTTRTQGPTRASDYAVATGPGSPPMRPSDTAPRASTRRARTASVASAAALGCAVVIARIGWHPVLPADCLLATAAAPLAAADLTERRLPDRIILPAIAATVILLGLAAWRGGEAEPLLRSVLAALAAGTSFLLLAVITQGIGGGDIKTAALISLPLGWLGWDRLLLGLTTGLTLAAVPAAVLVLTRRVRRDDRLPLGPALLLGALTAVLL